MGIIFKQVDEIYRKLKTQTRRVCKDIPSNMTIGKTYKFEIMINTSDDWSPRNPDNTNFPGPGVYIRTYTHGGWLNGDVCVEPEWYDTAKWIIGREYAVIPGRGRPGVRLGNDQYERECLVYVDRCKSAHSERTIWEVAKTDKFIATGKPDPEMFLLNDGLYPFRVKILEIWREPVQEISEEDAKAEGVKGTSINGEPMNPVFMYQKLWKSINKRKGTRWEDNPIVWTIRFEVADKFQ